MAAVTAAILGIAGCYGQTDLASNVDEHGATLNSRGTANNGPADVFFEYWKSASPANKQQTAAKTVPAGASGPFQQNVSGLDDHTAYTFRVCGKDQGASGDAVCAQTQTFTTGAASVRVYGHTSPAPQPEAFLTDIEVNVAAGMPGGAPLGRFFAVAHNNGPGGPPGGFSLPFGSQTADNITCLNVQGNVAKIGFRQIPPNPDSVPVKNVMHALVIDGGPAGSGRDRIRAGPTFEDEDPNECTIPANPASQTVPLRNGEASVSGTTSVPTLR